MKLSIKQSGIYKITNKVNNKIYIGSAVNIKTRWSKHIGSLNKNKHENRYLQNSWNKYGGENFKFEVLEYVKDKEKLIEREQYWIDKTNCTNRNIGYNICPKAGSCLGKKCTKEQIEKMREKALGRKASKETRIKLSEIRTGELNSRSKINEETAKIIKYLTIYTKVRIVDIAKYYGIDDCSVLDIKKCRNWSHITIDNNFLTKEESYAILNEILKFNKQPTIRDIIEIKLLQKYSILNQSEISKLYNIDKNLVHKIAIEKYRFNPSISYYKSLPYYLEEISYKIAMKRSIATINDNFRKIIVYFIVNTNLSRKQLMEVFNIKHSSLDDMKHNYSKEYIVGYALPLFYQKILEEL